MPPKSYLNFDLLIDHAADGYQARVLYSPGGQASLRFTLPFSVRELESGFTLIGGGIRAYKYGLADDSTSGQPLDPKTIGTRLYTTIFRDNVGACLLRSLNLAAQQEAGLRIRLRLTDVPDLADLPWEYLYDTEANRFLGLSDQTPIVRYMELPAAEQPLGVQLPLRILAMVSDPSNILPRLDVEAEWKRLQSALERLEKREHVILERLNAATLPALQRRLQQPEEIHVLHFIGHGAFDPAGETSGLMLEDGSGRGHLVAAEMLGTLLHDHTPLRLAFLNACEGARADHQEPFAGVAQHLVRQGLPAVIAMQFAVTDRAAIALTQEFYQALAAGYPVDAALVEARKAIYTAGNLIEWGTPVLFLRGEGLLFDVLDIAPPPACPYPGMMPFRAEDARFFFGREDEIAELRRRLRFQNYHFVIGPSGSGKSSLIFAGLIPALGKQEPDKWTVKMMRPGATPLAALQTAIGHLIDLQTFKPSNLPTPRLLLVVDQFEELFVQAAKPEQTAFIAALKALRPLDQVVLIITMRADFYPDLMNCELWPVDPSQRLEIAPLRGNALRQAIERPAANVGVTLETGLVERLLADAADEPGVLPLLQETMRILWDEQIRRVLPLVAYTRLGSEGRSGLAVAMATKADATLAQLTPAHQVIARRIFLRLVQFGEGRSDTRRQQSLAELGAVSDDAILFEQTLRHLTDHRLLTLSGGEGETERKVDIAHEMLIVGWPLAQSWVQSRREAELTRRRLEDKAAEWVRLGRGSGGLLDADELPEAERWLAGSDVTDLGYDEALSSLVKASREAIDQAEQAKAAAATRLRRLAYLATGVGIIAIIFAILASRFGYQASENAALAQAGQATAVAASGEAIRGYSRQLAVQAQSLIGTDLDTALVLAVEANHITKTAEAKESLLATVTANPSLRTFLPKHKNTITGVAISPDGQRAASAGDWNGSIELWDIPGRSQVGELSSPSAQIVRIVWHPERPLLAAGDLEGRVVLWDLSSAHALSRTLDTHPDTVGSLAFSPNGALIASSSCSTPGGFSSRYCEAVEIRIWDIGAQQPITTIGGLSSTVEPLAFSFDGRFLASGGCGERNEQGYCRMGEIRLWEADKDWALWKRLTGHDGPVLSLAFNPQDGNQLVSGGQGSIIVWDIGSGQQQVVYPDQRNIIYTLRFDRGGTQLASTRCGVFDFSTVFNPRCTKGSVIFWDFSQGLPTTFARQFSGHTDWIADIAFAPDGHSFLTGGLDRRLVLWDTEASYAPGRLLVQQDTGIYDVAFSPDDQLLAVSECTKLPDRGQGCVQGEVQLWDAISYTLVATLPIPGSAAERLVFSPDQRQSLLAIGGCKQLDADGFCIQGEILLWDPIAQRISGASLTGHTDSIRSLAFSSDGGKLASGSWDGSVIIWDIAERRPLTGPFYVSNNYVGSVGFDPDGKLLATSGGDGALALWNVETGERVGAALAESGASAAMLAFSPVRGADLLASGGRYQHPPTLWQLADLPQAEALTNNQEGILALAFSNDGSILATSNAEGAVTLWDVTERRTVGSLFVDPRFGAIDRLAFDSTAMRLASSTARAVILWDLDPSSWEVAACQRANRAGLDEEEWRHYFGSEPQRPTCSN